MSDTPAAPAPAVSTSTSPVSTAPSSPAPATAPMPTASITPAPMSAGVATAVAIVSGTRRALVQVNGQWYDLPGLSRADLLSDPRYAGRLTFASITNVSQAQAGAAPVGIDGSAVPHLGAASSAPVRNVQMPAEGQVTVGTQSKFAQSEQNAAITAVRAVVGILNAAKAAPAAAPAAPTA